MDKPTVNFQIGKYSQIEIAPIEAASKAAQIIFSEYGPAPVYLPLSGGIDSECVARSFLFAGISFTPVIMKFKYGYNDFDTVWAYKFCHEFNLVPKTLELDLEKFFRSEKHLSMAEMYSCRSPQIATHLWLADQLEGNVVFPHCIPPLFRTPKGKLFVAFPSDLHCCYDRFFDYHSRPGVGLFFLYTPELVYSFLRLRLYQEMLFNSVDFFRFYSDQSYLIKYELYRSGGFQIQIRPDKATGFELFRQQLNRKYHWHGSDYFDQHYRLPMEAIVQDSMAMPIGEIDLGSLYDFWINSV